MKHILSRTTASIAAAAALVLAGATSAQAQIWLSPSGLAQDLGSDINDVFLWGESHGNPLQFLGQTFTAPSENPELRQIWALGFQGRPGDVVDIHVAPWDDANQRVSGPPVFNSGPRMFAVGTKLQTTTLRLPEPLMLTPGGRYIIIVRTPFAPGATVDANGLGRTTNNIFPNGAAFRVTNIPSATPLDITTFDWDGDYDLDGVDLVRTDFALQPAFTQPGPQLTILAHSASNGTGSPVGDQPGTTVAKFGIPSRNSAGHMVCVATGRYADGKFAGLLLSKGTGPQWNILARQGDGVPGRPGVFFSSFKDPLLVEDGRIVVLASLTGAGITSANNMGLYFYTPGGAWTAQLHKGDEPPGIPGARIRSLQSVAASDAGVALVYQMVIGPNFTPGPGGVTRATDTAFTITNDQWQFPSSPYLRKGSNWSWGVGNTGTLASFSALTARAGAPGHGHGVHDIHPNVGSLDVLDDSDIWSSFVFQSKFTDGRVGNFSVRYIEQSPTVTSAVVTRTPLNFMGDTGTHEVVSLGIPGQSRGGDSAFVGKLKTGIGGVNSFNDIFIATVIGEGASPALLAREGTVPLGAGNAALADYASPVLRYLGDTGTHEAGQWLGFTAKLRGPGVTSTNDRCVSRMVGQQFMVVAREGSEAPGVPGSQFNAFSSLAFMDYTDDSCMNALAVVGKMRTGLNGTPGPGGVTKFNDDGLWLFDHNGDGHLALREGSTHLVGGITKTVKSFTVLSNVPYSPAQTRSHNAVGEIILRVIFTDGKCALAMIHE